MANEAANREAFRIQRFYCERMDAPIYARLCDALADGLSRRSRTGARVLDWPGEPTRDALPLRLVGGLHALVRSGADAGLTAVFAGAVTAPAAIVGAVEAALAGHDEAVWPWLDGPPQTNEPGRSAALMTGLLAVAQRFGLPLALLEIGSSAGLNLLIDRYAFDLGGTRLGPADAAVTIRPDWRGAPPAPTPIAIGSTSGCDIQPLDVADPAVEARLMAYVWAETPARAERLAAAIALARASGVDLVRADAADWVEARLAAPQPDGVVRVLMHSVVWQYLPPATAARIKAAMAAAGARATAATPLAWVQMEPDRDSAVQQVWVRTWPDGEPFRPVAFAHAHGTWVEPIERARGEQADRFDRLKP